MTTEDHFEEAQLDDALASMWDALRMPAAEDLDEIARSAAAEQQDIARPIRPRVFRPGWALALAGLALLVGSGLGFGLGSSVTPSSSAAGPAVGLGFLPEPGWDVLQTGARPTEVRSAVAITANVPLARDDTARDVRLASGLPYSTLLTLPRRGIVIVARFTVRNAESDPRNLFPRRTLPLRLRDASPSTAFSVQVRPERPLGQYLLRAGVNGHNVELQIYFGTSTPAPIHIEAAQRQIDRLVVSPTTRSASVEARAFPLRPTSVQATAAERIVDRTLLCATALIGGAREIEARGHRGTGRSSSVWDRPAWVAVSTGAGTSGIGNPSLLDNSLAWITAGRPSATATFVERPFVGDNYRIRIFGTLAINGRLCRPAKVRIALGPTRLQGGALGPFEDEFTCATARRVVIRVRAVLATPGVLRGFRSFARTTIPVREAQLAVQTESGKRLAYGEVFPSGKARLFTAGTCFPS